MNYTDIILVLISIIHMGLLKSHGKIYNSAPPIQREVKKMEFDVEEVEEVTPKHPFCNGSGGLIP